MPICLQNYQEYMDVNRLLKASDAKLAETSAKLPFAFHCSSHLTVAGSLRLPKSAIVFASPSSL
jgi:hypothetical protein